jgi:hypothetical protein
MKLAKVFAPLLILALLASCTAHVHKIGAGSQKGDVVKKKQWYVLFGLVPLNNVDSAVLAGDAKDYQIKTVYNVDDVLISFFTSYVTISCRSVEVTK